MKKSSFEGFINRYNLGGEVESVKVTSTDAGLSVNFISDDNTVDGFLAHEVSLIVPEAISGAKDAMAVETRYTADDVETQGDTPSKNVGDPKTYSSSVIDPQGIDQSKLVPLLVKTIQELEARIKTLEDA